MSNTKDKKVLTRDQLNDWQVRKLNVALSNDQHEIAQRVKSNYATKLSLITPVDSSKESLKKTEGEKVIK